MVKATITMKDETVLEHKFKSIVEYQRWLERYRGEYINETHQVIGTDDEEEQPTKKE